MESIIALKFIYAKHSNPLQKVRSPRRGIRRNAGIACPNKKMLD
jgi:hypothetical protein